MDGSAGILPAGTSSPVGIVTIVVAIGTATTSGELAHLGAVGNAAQIVPGLLGKSFRTSRFPRTSFVVAT
jgi:hypothetical protein